MIVVNGVNWIVQVFFVKLACLNFCKVVLIVNIINWITQILQVCKLLF